MGLYLAKPEMTKNTKVQETPQFTYVETQLQGWKIHQDEIILSKPNFDQSNSLFLILCKNGGNEVAQYIIDNFIPTLIEDKFYKSQEYGQSLTNVYETLDQKLKNTKAPYQGCMLITVLLTQESVYVANAGLSRAIVKVDGNHKVMSVDHFPQNDLEKLRILNAGGEVWENRLNVHFPFSRSLGNFEYKSNPNLEQNKQLMIAQPSLKWVERENVEFILVGSHGFWENWSNSAIADAIKERLGQEKDVSEIVEAIMETTIAPNLEEQYGKENVSCILIVLKQTK